MGRMPSRKEDATLFRLLMATKAKLLNLKTGPSEKPAYNNRSKIPFPKIDHVSCSLTSLSIIFAINLFNSEASYPISSASRERAPPCCAITSLFCSRAEAEIALVNPSKL